MTTLKLCYGDDIRRIPSSLLKALHYSQLQAYVRNLFSLNTPFILKYCDDEKDLITLSSDIDLAEAIQIAVSESRATLRISVLVTPTTPNLTTPILSPGTTKKGKAKVKKEKKKGKKQPVHKGVRCDGCGVNPIRGNRYKCAVCPDFDFCEECDSGGDSHVQLHPFLKIRECKQAPAAIQVILTQSFGGSEVGAASEISDAERKEIAESDTPAVTHGVEEMKDSAEEEAPIEAAGAHDLSEDEALAAAMAETGAIAETLADVDAAETEAQCSPEAQEAAMTEAKGVADAVAAVEAFVVSDVSTDVSETPVAAIEVEFDVEDAVPVSAVPAAVPYTVPTEESPAAVSEEEESGFEIVTRDGELQFEADENAEIAAALAASLEEAHAAEEAKAAKIKAAALARALMAAEEEARLAEEARARAFAEEQEKAALFLKEALAAEAARAEAEAKAAAEAEAKAAAEAEAKEAEAALLTKYAAQIRVLQTMGFTEVETNLLPLLQKHDGDMMEIIQELYD